ncbi:NAD-glutamate dehydrogenase domain-containing protein, partial [Marinobacterium nitratireducens]|uniref:NAD-glutamate dehydrogenase domain-containing protein n=1 Tax=Marinobacterium nitratireducens TaxID=518897 RepID=UPI0016633238
MDTSPIVASPRLNAASAADTEALISRLHTATEAGRLRQLLNACFRHQLSDAQLPPGDLYGALNASWQHLQHRREEVQVVVFNTDSLDWHCHHSIIEILMDDRPFIAASCLAELGRHGIRVHHQAYPVLHVRRDDQGRLLELCPQQTPGTRDEVLVRFEIDRQADQTALDTLRQDLARVLEDVCSAVADWQPMLTCLEEAARGCEMASDADAETVAFLRWLADENFLFVGFRYYDVEDRDGCLALHYRDHSGLGCFREPISETQRQILLDASQSRLLREPKRLVLTRSTTLSTVQQSRHLDYIGVKNFDDDGRLIGEWRFFGLYSSKAYDTPVSGIPLIRRHVERLLGESGLPHDSHSYKALRHLLFNYPRDEMLQSDFDQLRDSVFGMLDAVERRRLGLFLRPDAHDRFIKVLMLVPRDQYHTGLRIAVQTILLRQLGGYSADFSVRLSEDPLALIEFCIHCRHARQVHWDREQLQALVLDAMESWQDRFHQALLRRFDESRANDLLRRFGARLPVAYHEATPAEIAAEDIRQLAALDDARPLATRLTSEAAGKLRLRVLGRGRDMTLSDVLPILEHLGVRVLTAVPYQLRSGGVDEIPAWILDFQLACDPELDLQRSAVLDQFQQSFTRTYGGELEDDRFHQLVLRAGLAYRDVTLLRAVSKYLQQLGVPFSQHYIEQALGRNPQLSRQLCELFVTRFDPAFEGDREAIQASRSAAIEAALEQVDNLDEDRILRHYLGVIQAMLRTNFYQTDGEREKGYLSFKLDTRSLPFAPEPRPAFEIFVYAPWV